MTDHKTENDTLREVMEKYAGATVQRIAAPGGAFVDVLLLPEGIEAHGIKEHFDAYRVVPERRIGTAKLTSLDSFIDHALRFKAPNSVVFASNRREAPSVTSVLDYHEAGPDERAGTRNSAHRGHYAFPLSDEWKAWAAVDGKPMSHMEFAEFVEDRITDVIEPISEDAIVGEPNGDAELRSFVRKIGGRLGNSGNLIDLSRGLKVTETARVKSAQNLSTGEIQIGFETEHQDENGAPIKVPSLFLIGIPVFLLGPAYRLAVRLRYRLNSSKVSWTVQLFRSEQIFDHALTEALDRVKTETELPLLLGTPEA